MLSPNQAAKRAGVSRRTIMVAIENQRIKANKNNQGNWKIDSESLEYWMNGRETPPSPAHDTSTDSSSDTLSPDVQLLLKVNSLEKDLEAAHGTISQLEGERDRLYDLTQSLANKPARKWWPF